MFKVAPDACLFSLSLSLSPVMLTLAPRPFPWAPSGPAGTPYGSSTAGLLSIGCSVVLLELLRGNFPRA